MNTKDTVNKILSIPREFNNLRNTSIYSLLKESGYFETYNQVKEVDIAEALKKQPECITDWLMWSEDKRSSSGWYLKQNEFGKYTVGYFPERKDFKLTEYSDLTEACAVFIKREIEEIRNE